ncbi:MAG: sulfur carrier protein ThiS [Luteolibacter sp.]
MNIILNGTPYEIDDMADPIPLETLLQRLELSGKPVVVEVDETAILQRNYAVTTVAEGSRVEVVALAAGG